MEQLGSKMRKLINKKIKEEPKLEPARKAPMLDDRTIRAVLRNSCNELQERVFSGFMNDNIRIWLVKSLPVPSETSWIDPEFMKETRDLFAFWNLYAQRQVFLFEQESSFLENWDNHEIW